MARSPHIRQLLCALAAALVTLAASAAQASGAPTIKRAAAVDSDGDGKVDAFDVAFSVKLLKAKGKPRGKIPFTVRGYKVTRLGTPKGKRVRVRVAEGTRCDLGAKPRITFRGGRQLTDSRKRRLRRSRIDMGRRDRRRPRLTCSVTADRDGDGHIDSLVLTWSRRVRSPASRGGGQFGVNQYSITSVSAAKGRFVTLRLKEKAAFDTGEVPAVFYRRPKKASRGVRATARRRGTAASTTYNDTRDQVVARLVSARTTDAGLNGLVDGVVARFSETVKADPAAIAVEGARVTSVAKLSRDSFSAVIAEGPLRGDARPQVAFGTAAKVVRDLAGNVAPRTSVKAADGAAPVIVAARTLDRGGAGGSLDALALTWSEPISHVADSDGSYPFGVTGYGLKSAGGAAGSSLELALHEGPDADGGLRPPVGYTRGAGAAVRDAAANEAPSHVFAGAGDGVAPRLLSASTGDTDSDGKLDRIRYEFSEPISSPARACPVCGFTVGSGLSPTSALAGTGSAVEVAVTETALNGALEPSASYSPASGGAVRDPGGNAAQAGTVIAADGAPPVALDAYTGDSDSDARIDRVTVTFSEALSYPGDAGPATSFTASGYTVASVGAAAGTSLALNLTETVDPDTGSAPEIGYDGDDTELRDTNGVEHANRSWPNLTRDAVVPQFVEARTADLNADSGNEVGKVDAVELVYSEEITGTPDVGDFQVGGVAPAAIAFDPQSVKLRVAEGSSYDTDATMPVSYAPGDLTDVAEGPGDTADPAPAASTMAFDGAAPAIVEARTADTAGTPNGKVDHLQMTFSEPMTYADGLPAIGLTAPTMGVTAVTVDSATQLTATVAENVDPNGGAKPEVTVTDPARITDGAGNDARPDPFGGTTDQVAPVLVGARLGEAASGACDSAVVNGKVDCVRATWSEQVVEPSGFAALSLASPFTIASLLSAPVGPDVDAGFPEGAGPDRDRTSSFTYTGGGADEVLDAAGNPSLTPVSVPVAAACQDTTHEPNDAQDVNNPVLAAETVEKLCSGDSDWFRVEPTPSGELSIRVDPNQAIATELDLVHPDGSILDSAGPLAPGSFSVVGATGLTEAYYYLHVRAAVPQEGAYCIDTQHVTGDTECDDEDEVDQ